MPLYNDLRLDADLDKTRYAAVFPQLSAVERRRTIDNLLALRQGLDQRILPKRADANLLVGSWNIKEFGNTKQRLPEAYFYIAEILNRLDLIVIQEVKKSLSDLYIVMQLLGDDWDYIINDITEGDSGNSERSGFIYNKKRVRFGGLAGEIVLWPALTQNSTLKQLKRTPYITGFKAGWKTFAIVNLHLHPGDDKTHDIPLRRTEVELLLAALEEKKSKGRLWNDNLILAGDFNFYNGATKDDPTVQIVEDAGYREVESLKGVDTNASQTESYDRLFLTRNEYFRVGQNPSGVEQGGVFQPFDFVYRDGDEQTYKDEMKAVYGGSKDLDDPAELTDYYQDHWRRNQISDHYPIWFELIIDSSDEFLKELKAGA